MEGFDLSKRRGCELLGLNRSTAYDAKQPVSPEDLAMMEAIERQYTQDPCYGVRRMTAHLNKKKVSGQSQAGWQSDAADEPDGHLPEAQHQQEPPSACDLSLSLARSDD